jgi:hypothetical protein
MSRLRWRLRLFWARHTEAHLQWLLSQHPSDPMTVRRLELAAMRRHHLELSEP